MEFTLPVHELMRRYTPEGTQSYGAHAAQPPVQPTVEVPAPPDTPPPPLPSPPKQMQAFSKSMSGVSAVTVGATGDVTFSDPTDGSPLVFHGLSSGAYYSVGGEARPVFQEAAFGKDVHGFYIEFDDIGTAVSVAERDAPAVIRNLKALFEGCGVKHNLRKQKGKQVSRPIEIGSDLPPALSPKQAVAEPPAPAPAPQEEAPAAPVAAPEAPPAPSTEAGAPAPTEPEAPKDSGAAAPTPGKAKTKVKVKKAATPKQAANEPSTAAPSQPEASEPPAPEEELEAGVSRALQKARNLEELYSYTVASARTNDQPPQQQQQQQQPSQQQAARGGKGKGRQGDGKNTRRGGRGRGEAAAASRDQGRDSRQQGAGGRDRNRDHDNSRGEGRKEGGHQSSRNEREAQRRKASDDMRREQKRDEDFPPLNGKPTADSKSKTKVKAK